MNVNSRSIRNLKSVHGVDPQHLVEKIVRDRIHDSLYWKEECFALNPVTLIEKAIQLQYIGGLYGNQRVSPFLCLLLKLLQLQPGKDVVMEYIKNEEFKYLRALGSMYCRLVFSSKEVYTTLEPLLQDYRKLRERNMNGFFLTHMDEYIDSLLTEERVFGIILPRLAKRFVLETTEGLPPKFKPLEKEIFLNTTPHSQELDLQEDSLKQSRMTSSENDSRTLIDENKESNELPINMSLSDPDQLVKYKSTLTPTPTPSNEISLENNAKNIQINK